MKSLEKAAPKHGGAIRPSSNVAVDADKRSLTVTIVIPMKGTAQRALSQPKHQLRLKQDVEHLVDGVLASSRPAASVKRLADQVNEVTQPAPVRTKEPNSTIGVTSTEYLRAFLVEHAGELDQQTSVVARDMFERGLELFEKRLWDEASAAVLKDFRASYAEFQSDNTKQWSLRLPRKRYLKAVLLAKEQGISLSELACLCIAVSGVVVAA
ncbi:hypothetical protein PE066_11190 [Ramlibacter tataouinensis]|uniref:hypothetical protein n=1 Tax=Ramlibacter tataouinensis TaxID=94132 RepID=UPI0022F3A3D5|nr:hypothetical protein [Ramlibacter tataouinensis]WBY00047.1 hypothetical protein PE066_11190 [Ramlibacter tataouinensis]